MSSFFLQNTLLMYSQPNFCFSRIIQADFQTFCTMDFRALSIAPLLGQKGHESLAVQSLLFSIATFFPGNKYSPYLNIGEHKSPKGGKDLKVGWSHERKTNNVSISYELIIFYLNLHGASLGDVLL